MSAGLPAAAAIGPRLPAWLLRPYIDLGPCVMGPLYARGIDEYWRAFSDPAAPPFNLQRTLPPVFRTQLLTESGQRDFLVSDPRELPPCLRSDRWSVICDALDEWGNLPPPRKRALVLLLQALCLYEPVLRLIPEFNGRPESDDPVEIELSYWRASARYVLAAPSRISDYREADVSLFEAIAVDAPHAFPAAFNSAVKLVAHKAKTGASVRDLVKWRGRLERLLADALNGVDRFTQDLLTSRFYRVVAFLPQRRRNRAEVVRVMDLAERHARRMKPCTAAQELIYLENLHPVMESRTKEALWLGNRALALKRSRQVVRLDPYDSKAWVELGQVHMARKEWEQAAEAYIAAAMLGPPASAIGRHMAGVCFRKCGLDRLAGFLFKDTLEIDALGISPHDEIRRLPNTAIFAPLKAWSLRAF
jgi:tetratricopeptide (TPR) repeat protein